MKMTARTASPRSAWIESSTCEPPVPFFLAAGSITRPVRLLVSGAATGGQSWRDAASAAGLRFDPSQAGREVCDQATAGQVTQSPRDHGRPVSVAKRLSRSYEEWLC